MTTISTAKAFYFPDDVFKQIISYTESLPQCDIKKCRCVATEVCENCDDEFCKSHMEVDDENGLCKKCVNRGFAMCEICYNELTNMECDRCYSKYCVECVMRDEGYGMVDDRCIECGDASDDE